IASARLGRPMRDQYKTDGAQAWMQLDDGRVARVDATTLAAAIDETPPDHGRLSMTIGVSRDIETGTEIDLGGARWRIGTGPRALAIDPRTGEIRWRYAQ